MGNENLSEEEFDRRLHAFNKHLAHLDENNPEDFEAFLKAAVAEGLVLSYKRKATATGDEFEFVPRVALRKIGLRLCLDKEK